MEIINETVHVVGEINGWEVFRIVIGILVISCSIWGIIQSFQVGQGVLGVLTLGIIALLFCGAVVMCFHNVTNKVEYREYDVIFTEPVDMDELTEKYEIKGNDGRIWHLEDKH